MAKICILSTLLLQLVYTSVEGQNSPCPNTFEYIKKPESDEKIGQIKIRNLPISNLEVHLKVNLKVTTLLTPYVGRVDLTKSKKDAARDVLKGRPLEYHIHFPVQNPLPTVHRIWFNHNEICSGPEVSGSIITTITLEHTLKIIIQSSQNQSNSQQAPPYLQIPRSTPPAFVDNIENYNECGISGIRGSPDPLVAHGKKTLRGQWPWVAAIFLDMNDPNPVYQCGGTILTTKHVLTAGHCLKTSQFSNETIPANILSVALGRYKLMNFSEPGSLNMNVTEYFFHPGYKHTATADYDLAILILRFPVEFTAFIRFICLLSPTADSRRLEQIEGIIVGWGEDEHGNHYTEEPRLATMPIVRTEVCLWSNARFVSITSERTFCAGSLNHSVPCNGDSGSGLVIYDSDTDRYLLRGVVSRKLYDQQSSCNETQYVVFVDVFKNLDWINLIIKVFPS